MGDLTRRANRPPASILQTSNAITLKTRLPLVAAFATQAKHAAELRHACLGLQSQFYELQSTGNR
jgi:hypothetical protein